VEEVAGLSAEHPRWRFTLRTSNTAPLIRLIVETRGTAAMMKENTAEILARLDAPA
jgi:phosphomannomutase